MPIVSYNKVTQVTQQPAGACIVRVLLPLPPGINQSYKLGENAIYATKALTQFKRDAHLMLSNQDTTWYDWKAIQKIHQLVTSSAPHHTPLIQRTRIYTRTLWYYDIDAFGKACTDAVFKKLGMAAYDNLIVDERTTKEIDQNNPRIELELYCAVTADDE